VVLTGDRKGAYSVSVGKCEKKRKLRRPRFRWDASIKIGVQEIEWGCGLNRSVSGKGQRADVCKYDNEPSAIIQCWEFLDYGKIY